MAEPDAGRGARVVRIPVRRPVVAALTVIAFGAALLAGGGADRAPGVSALPTVPAATADPPSPPSPPTDWDVTPRDVAMGLGNSTLVALDQALATGLDGFGPGVAGAGGPAGAFQPVLADLGSAIGTVGGTTVPEVLWSAYRAAATSVPASCKLPVPLLAAIGQVESGSLAGRALDSRHRVVPAVLGPVLDGNGFAAIRDTDGGRWDGHPTWDRAVGPMQFIPSTWQRWGRDGNADGTLDPQNVEDAAFSAAAYLCAGGRDLSTRAGLRSAILSYNHSDVYLADVLRLMRTVTPGGPLPRSVVTLPFTPARPFTPVGPPSRPPVRAVARPNMPPASSAPRPSTSGTATTPSSSTTTMVTTAPATSSSTTSTGTTTTGTTTTGTTTTSVTSTTTTSASPTGSSTTTTTTTTTTSTPTGTTITTTTTTAPSSTCPAASSTTTTSTDTSTASTTTAVPAPETTTPAPVTTTQTSPTETPTDTTSTTTAGETPDPCASTAAAP